MGGGGGEIVSFSRTAILHVVSKCKIISVLTYVIKHYAVKSFGEVEAYLHHS
jgi:hypothetical protein